MNLDNIKYHNTLDIVQKLCIIFATILGGLWVLYQFLFNQEYHTTIYSKINAEQIVTSNTDRYFIKVVASIRADNRTVYYNYNRARYSVIRLNLNDSPISYDYGKIFSVDEPYVVSEEECTNGACEFISTENKSSLDDSIPKITKQAKDHKPEDIAKYFDKSKVMIGDAIVGQSPISHFYFDEKTKIIEIPGPGLYYVSFEMAVDGLVLNPDELILKFKIKPYSKKISFDLCRAGQYLVVK